MKKAALAAMVAVGLILSMVSLSSASGNEGVCQPQDAHLPGGNFDEITIVAPDGQLITGYCVKAGSINQGNGPEYVTLDPPVASVTISHSSGKDISHYVVFYSDIPEETTTTTVVETTTTTVPETTTTTVPETTTTTVVEETTTTVPETTTTVGETTTTLGEKTSSTQITTVPTGQLEELPRTGAIRWALLVLGLALVIVGTIIMRSGRQFL